MLFMCASEEGSPAQDDLIVKYFFLCVFILCCYFNREIIVISLALACQELMSISDVQRNVCRDQKAEGMGWIINVLQRIELQAARTNER